MRARLLIILPLLYFAAGCKIINTELGSEDSTSAGLKITLDFPSGSVVLTNPQEANFQTSGRCHESIPELVVTSPVRELIPCANGTWSLTLDLNHINEGPFHVRLESTDGAHFAQRTFVKKFKPSYQIAAKKERQASRLQNMNHTGVSASNAALVYSSDEACATSNCAALNIVLRLRSDNYTLPYFVTNDILISSTHPRVANLDNHRLRIFYLTSETLSGAKNIYFKDFDTLTKLFTQPVQVTNTPSGVSHVHVLESSEGIHEIAYLSKEYCSLNNCDVTKPSFRKSSDNYSTLTFGGLHNTCAISELRATLDKFNGDLHLAYKLLDAPGCDVETGLGERNKAGSVEHIVRSREVWNAPNVMQFIHFGASKIDVAGDGTVYLFYRSHQVWERGQGCASWDLRYRTSRDGYGVVHYVPGGCPMQVGYPGDDFQPGTFLNANGDIELLTNRRLVFGATPKYAMIHTNSADGMASYNRIMASDFADYANYLFLPGETSSYEAFIYQYIGPDPGLIHVKISADAGVIDRRNLTGSIARSLFVQSVEAEGVGIFGISKDWCNQNGCDNENIFRETIGSDSKQWLTQIRQEGLVLANPLYAPRPGAPSMFVYSSNERDPTNWGVVYKSDADNFNIGSFALPILGLANYASALDVDAQNEVHLAQYQSGTLYVTHSSSGFLGGNRVNTDTLGYEAVQLRVRSDGQELVTYGSNSNGGLGRGRWSANLFATDVFTFNEVALRYGGRSPLWRPNGDAEVVYITDLDGDLRLDVVSRNSTDGFVATQRLFASSTQSVCREWAKDFIDAKYDSQGRLYVLYSAAEDNSSLCRLYMKRSDNWNATWKISTSETASYEPVGIFLKRNSLPTVCARTNFDLQCFDTNLITRE